MSIVMLLMLELYYGSFDVDGLESGASCEQKIRVN
jgi:hypothetical protein